MRKRTTGGFLAIFALVSGSLTAVAAAATPAPPTTNAAALAAIMGRVDTAQPFASAAGSDLSQWYTDTATGHVVVGVAKLTPAIKAAAIQTFGSSVQLVVAPRLTIARKTATITKIVHDGAVGTKQVSASGSVSPLAVTWSRQNDVPAYFGGDSIIAVGQQNPNGTYPVAQCTSAFEVQDTQYNYNSMLTDAHCEEDPQYDTTWYSGYVDSSNTLHVGNYEGLVKQKAYGNNLNDAMTITQLNSCCSYSPVVYNGAQSSANYVNVYGTHNLAVGDSICADGYISGAQTCGAKITQINMCVLASGVKVCNIAHATYTRTFCRPGDSGGPAYAMGSNGTSIYAAGTIEAISSLNGTDCYLNQLAPTLSAVHSQLIHY